MTDLPASRSDAADPLFAAPRDAAPATAARTIGFVNLAHGIDHLAMLIFPTAVLAMEGAFGAGFAELLPLSFAGFVLYGALSLPAGWLGDRWSRRGMMLVFFFGLGLSLIATGLVRSPLELAIGLGAVGAFAAIYHPVGTALLVSQARRVGRTVGLNGVCGNLGVALAAAVTGLLIDLAGWRAAFILPGAVAILAGLAFAWLVPTDPPGMESAGKASTGRPRHLVRRAFLVLAATTVIGGCVFNAATLILPKLAEARIGGWVDSAGEVGLIVSGVYLWGALAQILVGRALDRAAIRSAMLPLVLLQCAGIAGMIHAEGWLLVALGCAVMAGLFGAVTVNDAMIARYATDGWRGRAYALRYFGSFGASAMAVPLVAWLHGEPDPGGDGFVPVLTAMAAAALAILGAALWFPGGDQPTPSGRGA